MEQKPSPNARAFINMKMTLRRGSFLGCWLCSGEHSFSKMSVLVSPGLGRAFFSLWDLLRFHCRRSSLRCLTHRCLNFLQYLSCHHHSKNGRPRCNRDPCRGRDHDHNPYLYPCQCDCTSQRRTTNDYRAHRQRPRLRLQALRIQQSMQQSGGSASLVHLVY
jgi:hypothetical protein